MSKLDCTDFNFLNNIALKLENGENLERSFFLTCNVPEETLVRLQLGENLHEVISSIDFNYPALKNLFSSVDYADEDEVIDRVKSTSRLIRVREEVLKEKDSSLKVHRRRLKIIRYVTMFTIAMIAGFAPIFSNLYSFISTGEFTSSFSIWSILSISFLIINLLNNYYLLKMGNEEKIMFRLFPVIFLHSAIVIGVRFFILNLIPI
jgi:hypothetical protein